ncbi:MAG: hypothetical protein O3B24_10780 [Verrucomicrobia bacterium]|nr:hypothetical protein [Verrucomicrobiota bacterium]
MRPYLCLLVLVAVGCELPQVTPADDDDTTPTAQSTAGSPSEPTPASPTPSSDPAQPVDSAQAEWDAISWHTAQGPNCAGAVPVMSISAEIIERGSKVRFSFSHYPWSGDGLAHFFIWNGSRWDGGKFDHIRSGGQTIKLTENIAHGYNGLSIPPSGTPVAFAWTDAKGTQRSNLAKTTWP